MEINLKDLTEMVVANIPQAITIWKINESQHPGETTLVYANAQFNSEINESASSLIGKQIIEIFPNWQYNQVFNSILKVSESKTPEKLSNVNYEGETSLSTFEIFIIPLMDNYVACIFENITIKCKLENRLKKLVSEDPLTKVINYRGFRKKLREAIETNEQRNKMVAVLYIDLDNFKIINDNFGHETGNVMLQNITSKLRELIRKEDVIGRLGGDEFGIIIENITKEKDVEIVANKLIKGISEENWSVGQNEYAKVGLSIGIYLALTSDEELDDIIKNADAAMYLAKNSGGNKFCFYDSALENL